MIYQRHIPEDEMFSTQLELLMQHGQLGTVVANVVGMGATMAIFWPFVGFTSIMLWSAAFLILLLMRSLHMSNALVSHSYRTHPKAVFWKLISGAAATGLVWSSAYIYATTRVPITMQYTFLLLVVMITAVSVGFSVIIREYFIAFLFASLWPIAWWSLVHYWQEPYNLLIGLSLLAFCAMLVVICDRVHRSFCNMLALNWERETMARELGDMAGSLRDRNRQLRHARRQLTELANIDELTGLANRRRVNTALKAEVNRARRSGAPLSVIMLDVDNFKAYNDTYGHPAGDEVLQRLAEILQHTTSRAGETAGRYGGEEFILVLPGSQRSAAMHLAQRLQDDISEAAIPHANSDVAAHVTVSQGVVTLFPDADISPEDIVQLADKALYRAKSSGRDAIVVADDHLP